MGKEQIIVQTNPDVPSTGSDLGIVNAARKSFGRRSEWANTPEYMWGDDPILKDKDKRLLEFLARGMTADDFEVFKHNMVTPCQDMDLQEKSLVENLWSWRNTPTHDTPFNHGFFSFEIKAPIFVARHLGKHEYLLMSEYSRRYITEDVEFYQPDVWRKAAEDVKQGSSAEGVDISPISEGCVYNPTALNMEALATYQYMIETLKVAPEQARMVLPQSLMTSWTWSGTLGAFANMCKLRLGSDTQAETRYVAEKVYEELKKPFPIAAPLLVEGVDLGYQEEEYDD